MQIDAQLEWVSHSSAPQTAVGAAGINITFATVIDLLGSGAGTAPRNIIGTATLFGEEAGGIGMAKPEIQISIGTAFATSNSATANFAIQYAPDAGTPTYQPGTWETAVETGAKPASELTANQILRMAMPPTPPNTPRPRFIQLLMQVPAATNFTAGTVSFAGIVFARDDMAQKQQPRNYTVS